MNKKGFTLICLMVIGSIFILQCGENNPVNSNASGEKGLPRSLSKSEADLISSDNTFGHKLFKEIVTQDRDKNIFISPFSVAQALGMTYNGARGTTQEAMQSVLELNGMTLDDINQAYKSFVDMLLSLDTKVKLQIANSIWYEQNMSVEQTFIDLNKTYFDAEVTPLNFGDAASKGIINNWVDTKTNGEDRIRVAEARAVFMRRR